MIKRLWHFVDDKFLNREFITFCVIGLINTGLHIATLWVMYFIYDKASWLTEESIEWFRILSANAVAFCVASTFSYLANNRITFKNKKGSMKTFLEAIVIFLMRLGITELLTMMFVALFGLWPLKPLWKKFVAPFTASVLMIPLTYFALRKVLKKKTEEVIENQESDLTV